MNRRKRRSHHSGRAPLPSPGRPPAAERSELQRFWWGIAQGMASEDAARVVGMSQPVGTRMFRKAGGMPPAMCRLSAKPPSGRYLSFAEREEIALLRVQSLSKREIGRRLGRSASTISRELRRNAATRSGGLEYRASTAQVRGSTACARGTWRGFGQRRLEELSGRVSRWRCRHYFDGCITGGNGTIASRQAGRRCFAGQSKRGPTPTRQRSPGTRRRRRTPAISNAGPPNFGSKAYKIDWSNFDPPQTKRAMTPDTNMLRLTSSRIGWSVDGKSKPSS
jgi:DNA-binding CsgD family transcriptional regulator